MEAVADVVAQLFAEGGLDAVSIGATAEKLAVSRATLYRTVPNREDLVGVLFERSTRELTEAAQEIITRVESTQEKLYELIRLLVDAAVRMRRYMPVFFGSAELPADVFQRWHTWSRRYEQMWTAVVQEAMDAGVLQPAQPVITTRLLIGMCIWISRWYRENEPYSTADIAETAISLLRSPPGPGQPAPRPAS